jgi:pyridoxal biosynthesis lyase PdxS
MTMAAAHKATIPRRATTASVCFCERVGPEFARASAGVARMARIVKLQKNALLRVRTRTTTISFVGLRG